MRSDDRASQAAKVLFPPKERSAGTDQSSKMKTRLLPCDVCGSFRCREKRKTRKIGGEPDREYVAILPASYIAFHYILSRVLAADVAVNMQARETRGGGWGDGHGDGGGCAVLTESRLWDSVLS